MRKTLVKGLSIGWSAARRSVFAFALAYILLSIVFAIFHDNWEFVYYGLIITVLLLIVIFYHKPLRLTKTIMAGLLLVGFLHLLGGNFHIGDVRLYEFWIIEGLFRYDNMVHMLSSFVATLVVYNVLEPHMNLSMKRNRFLLGFILVLIVMGLGAFNEIIELLAVVFLDAGPRVGDYMNNSLDLVWNMTGSAIAASFFLRKKEFKENE